MSGKVYGIVGGSDEQFDPIILRRMLSSNSRSAHQQLQALSDLLRLEQNVNVADVEVRLEVGVYVRSAVFLSTDLIVMTFNNGKSIELSQHDGVYSIGEHVFSMSNDLRGAFDMNVLAHHKAVNLVLDGIFSLSNAAMTSLIYQLLPSVRKNCPDDFYNYYDITSYSLRIQQFKAYLSSGLYQVLIKPCSTEVDIVLACVGFGVKSKFLIEDLVVAVNSCLAKDSNMKYNLIFLAPGESYTGSSPVCYLMDSFVSPASLNLNVVSDSGSKPDITKDFDQALEFYGNYLHDNSSLLISSYKPIRDVFVDEDEVYSVGLVGYQYSQFSYVPHKPWTLINISLSTGVQFDLPDSSRSSPLTRLVTRIENDLKTLVINFRRNMRAANSKSKDQMRGGYYKVIKYLFEQLESFDLSTDISTWYQDEVMRFPVETTKTLVHGIDTDIDLAFQVMTKVSRMKPGASYSFKDLQVEGWNTRCLDRALYLDLIVPNKSGSVFSYFRKDKYDRGIKGYFYDDYVKNSPTHSLVDSLGGVISQDRNVSDEKVTFVDVPLVATANNSNYTQEAPYPISSYASRAVGLSVSKIEGFDHNEFLTADYSFAAYLDSRKTSIINSISPSESSSSTDQEEGVNTDILDSDKSLYEDSEEWVEDNFYLSASEDDWADSEIVSQALNVAQEIPLILEPARPDDDPVFDVRDPLEFFKLQQLADDPAPDIHWSGVILEPWE